MMLQWLKTKWHTVLAHLVGIVPLLVVGVTYLAGTLANPTRYAMLRTGTLGLLFLVATLACTPARKLFGWQGAIQIRRALGLYSFLYVSLHLWVYAVQENALDFTLIWRDLGERRAMPIGILAYLLLIPLAITSTRGWQRRLGKRWRTLHRLVYGAALLSVWHYLWLDRDFITLPLLYGAIVGLLLLLRLPMLGALVKYFRMAASR
ncbi:MAG: protein-methionine-sulfoxide reductase heme-binding subunit MsrQ [Caldilineaceae bacterium]